MHAPKPHRLLASITTSGSIAFDHSSILINTVYDHDALLIDLMHMTLHKCLDYMLGADAS